MTVAPPSAPRRRERGHDAVDVLVGHRGGDERQRGPVAPRGTAAGRRAPRPGPRHRPGCGRRRAAPRAVDLDQLEPARPASRRVAARAAPRPGRRRCRPPRVRRASRRRPPTFAAWCRPRSPTRVGPRPGSSTSIPSRSSPSSGAGSTLGQRDAEPAAPPPDHRERLARRAGHGEVAALDDRRLLAGDRRDRRPEPVHVVEVDVRDRGHATVPRVGRVESAAEARPRRARGRRSRSANQRKSIAVSSSNSVGSPSRRAIRSAAARASLDEPGERRRVDRPPADLHPLPVGHEVRLRRLAGSDAGSPERAAGEREDAALAVRPGDERPADASCGSPSSRSSARVRPRPRRIPKRPRSVSARSAPRSRTRSSRPRSVVTRASGRPRRRRTG